MFSTSWNAAFVVVDSRPGVRINLGEELALDAGAATTFGGRRGGSRRFDNAGWVTWEGIWSGSRGRSDGIAEAHEGGEAGFGSDGAVGRLRRRGAEGFDFRRFCGYSVSICEQAGGNHAYS